MAAAAASCDFGEGEAELGNARRCVLLWGPGESLRWLGDSGSECGASLPSVPSMAPAGGSGGGEVACTHEEQVVAFYRRRSRRFETIKKDEGGSGRRIGAQAASPAGGTGGGPSATCKSTPRASSGRELPQGRSPGEARVG
jgi:hypothetical protein